MGNKLPNSLIKRLNEDPFFDIENFKAIKREGRDAIRFNKHKAINLNDYPIGNPVPWCENAYYLTKRIDTNTDPLFYAGGYCLHDAKTMVLDYVMRELHLHSHKVKVLDLVATNGELSSMISSIIAADSLLVSNESKVSHSTALQANLTKWGNANYVITNNDASAFAHLPGYFDFLVVNAPSSHSKLSDEKEEVGQEHIKLHSERQKRLLQHSISSLKQDGYLFYAVESAAKEECEDIVEWLVDAYALSTVNLSVGKFEDIKNGHHSQDNMSSYRFIPDKSGHTFFFAVFKQTTSHAGFSYESIESVFDSANQSIGKEWTDREDLCTIKFKDNLSVFPKSCIKDLDVLHQVLLLQTIGLSIGRFDNNGRLLPSVDLVLSNLLNKAIPCRQVNIEEALLLAKGEKTCYESAKKASDQTWTVLQYKGVNIGWEKTKS